MTQVQTIPLAPPAGPLDAMQQAAVAAAIAAHQQREGALLPILHAVQDTLGFVPAAAIAPIAQALNLSRAEVHGVVSFYHHFRSSAPGRHVVSLCRAEACQAMGGAALEAALQRHLGIAVGQTSADGRISLAAVYCLGNCACAPSALIDAQLHGRLTAAALTRLVDELGATA